MIGLVVSGRENLNVLHVSVCEDLPLFRLEPYRWICYRLGILEI